MSSEPARGEIWHVELTPDGSSAGHIDGPTLVVVIQSDRLRYGRTVLAAPLTSNLERERPYGVRIPRGGPTNLEQDSIAMPWLTLAIDKRSLRDRKGRLDRVYVDRIVEVLTGLAAA